MSRTGGDPIAARLRRRRLALGLSLGALAERSGIRAPSFVHHVENGLRSPREEVAARLARALGEDEALFRAWARLRTGCAIEPALEAARTIERALAEAALPPPGAPEPPPAALMRVPRYGEGRDPGTLEEPGREVLEVLRFDPASLPREAWLKPFALRIGADVPSPPPLAAGDLALVTRNAWPIHTEALYVTRGASGLRVESLARTPAPPPPLVGRVAAVIRGALRTRDG